MEAKVVYVSKSGKSVLLSVVTRFGKVTNSISGFVGAVEGEEYAVGDVLTIPATSVTKEQRSTKDGVVFDFLVFA